MPNCLLKPDERSEAKCALINLNDVEVVIPKPTIELQEIQQGFPINLVSTKKGSYIPRHSTRSEMLQENLRTEHMNPEERDSLVTLCNMYNDIFHLPEDVLTTTETLKHPIPTTTNAPIFTKSYRYPKVHETEVKQQITKMLEQKIIQPSTSPYSSPVWVVPKKMDSSGNKK